jgi:hypothetical protein
MTETNETNGELKKLGKKPTGPQFGSTVFEGFSTLPKG